jgi:hypothetical protein
MCYLSKNPSKYFSFCDTVFAHEDVVVEFAIFHIILFKKKKKKGEKEKKKRHSSMLCESWWAPDGID